mmetsp:Transcript_76619/g.135788  ORF Transcript_76619/g.135788 Transcript_76619/m.135788 type:complete len:90 (-) Transcript_76619:1173-1442(-)
MENNTAREEVVIRVALNPATIPILSMILPLILGMMSLAAFCVKNWTPLAMWEVPGTMFTHIPLQAAVGTAPENKYDHTIAVTMIFSPLP